MSVPTSLGQTLLVLAGLSQLALAGGSLMLPRVLGWRDELAKVRPLTRQVFWTYASYIWVTNVCFGLLSTFAPGWLLERAPLSRAVSAYVAVYWGARLGIQVFYFGRAGGPEGRLYRVAEWLLLGLFTGWTLVYGYLVVAR